MKCHVLIWFAIVVLEPFRSWFLKLTASHVSRSFMIEEWYANGVPSANVFVMILFHTSIMQGISLGQWPVAGKFMQCLRMQDIPTMPAHL